MFRVLGSFNARWQLTLRCLEGQVLQVLWLQAQAV